jgi:hypothetical protein
MADSYTIFTAQTPDRHVNFSQNNPQLGNAPSSRLKNIGLKGRHIISLCGAPICLGPGLVVSVRSIQKAYYASM